jgi:hypothetical protein
MRHVTDEQWSQVRGQDFLLERGGRREMSAHCTEDEEIAQAHEGADVRELNHRHE